jgi:ligand-binding sensor domain-containing protein
MKANFRADDAIAVLQISRMKPNQRTEWEGFYRVVLRHTRAIKIKNPKGERKLVKHKAIITTVALVISCGITVLAQTPEFNIVKPSTTGVPGEEVRLMKSDPAGNLWIAGRFYLWEEVALAVLSADQLDHQPLPGGGFDTGAWKVWSSVHHPIPSVYINDIAFGAGGVIWIASDGGLTRFDPAAPEAEMWFTYTPANSQLILSEVRSLAFDHQGNLWLTNVSVQFSSGALFRFNPRTNVWTQYRVGHELPWTRHGTT